MDINQSPLSGFKSNKTQNNRQLSDSRSSVEAARLKDSSPVASTQELKLSDLKEGQTLKGQVIDLRYNEVKLQIEPGQQVVTARVSSDVPLSIGQEARFQVTEDSSNQTVLKYLPNNASSSVDSTVQKVLTASNIPITERNKALVTELLNHRMPVDKISLQNLIRISLANREASPLTLVLMHKNSIPLSSANIKQFEAYQNGTHQLLNDIKTISQNISEVLKQEDTLPSDEPKSQLRLDQNSQNGNLHSEVATTGNQQAILLNGKLISILNNSSQLPVEATGIPLGSILNEQELTAFSKALEQTTSDTSTPIMNVSPELLAKINNGTLSLEDAVKLLPNLNSEQLVTSVLNNTSDSVANLALNNTTNPVINELTSKLLEQIMKFQDSSAKISDLLNQSERNTLFQPLSELPNETNAKENILQGTASLKETLNFVQESLSQLDPKAAAMLLQAPEYSKLLEEAFLQKWTITPDKAANKSAVNELYQQLQEDLEQISVLTKTAKAPEDALRFQEPVKNMQENLHFMKDLNDVFTYIQLPVQFKDHEAHTDLYVFTRKNAMNDKKEALSVLLHLDMTNLGPLNVHVKMDQDQIHASFYLEDAKAGNLIRENLPLLTDSLEKKGYHVHADVKDDYKKPDFSRDFIEQNSQDNNVKRYTFDIRT